MSVVLALHESTGAEDTNDVPQRLTDHEEDQLIREKFLASVAAGLSPATTAVRLGVPVATVRVWLNRLAGLAADLRLVKGRSPRDISKRPLVTGITLVHTCDVLEASVGQIVTFTSWVMNDSLEPLKRVTLVPRSFTNAGLENLSYVHEPSPSARNLGTLMAGNCAVPWEYLR